MPSDIATHEHSSQGGVGWPELRTAPLAELEANKSRLDAAYAYRRSMSYGYGLSNPDLRPVVVDEDDTPPVSRNALGRKRRTHIAVSDIPAPIRHEYRIVEPVIMPAGRKRYVVTHPAVRPEPRRYPTRRYPPFDPEKQRSVMEEALKLLDDAP